MMRPPRPSLVAGLCAALLLLTGCGDGAEASAFTNKAPEPIQEKDWVSLIDGQAVIERTKRITGIGPRVPGTKGAQHARDEIVTQLYDAGVREIDLKTFTAKTPDFDAIPDPQDKTDATFKNETSFTNIIARIPGKRDAGPVLAAHYDSKHIEGMKFVGANDSASAVALLIEIGKRLAKEAAEKQPEHSIWFVFFDGEESFRDRWQDPDHTYGSRNLAANLKNEEGQLLYPFTSLVLLDMVGAPDLVLADDGNSDLGLKKLFKATSREVFGYDLLSRTPEGGKVIDDHLSFLGTGIPAIDLIDHAFSTSTWWHQASDTAEILDPRSLEKVGTLVLTALPKLP